MSDWSKIIDAVRDPFGLTALVVLALLFLALRFFHPDSVKVRLAVFIVLMAAFIGLGIFSFSRTDRAAHTRVEIDRITVNRTCDKDDEAREAELRWEILIGAKVFEGADTIVAGTTRQLKGVFADYEDASEIVVRIRMGEVDRGGVVTSSDEQQKPLNLAQLETSLPARFEVEMWPGVQRNECDVRVGGLVSRME